MTDTPKRKLRLMHICGSPGPSGTEKFFLRLIQAQMAEGIYEIIPVVKRKSWLESELKKLDIPYYTAPFGGKVFRFLDFKTTPILDHLIDNLKPDLIQTWVSPSNRLVPQTNVPQVARMGRQFAMKYCKQAHFMVASTPDIEAHIRKSGFNEERVAQIPTFVEMPAEGFKDFRFDVRAEYNIPEDAPVVLLLGRLHETKGFDVALFALNLLPQNVHILLVGDGPQSRALKAAVEADRLSNRVRFVGWVDNITPFFAAADIFVLPSRRESSTNVVLEAWAHKLPVVATTIPAPKAMLSSGENALLVSPDSEQELARAIERLIAEQGLANQLAAAGHKKVKAEFARDAVLEKYRKLYQTALARQRGA
tara:strand:+ start:640633 stop:641727 length:1095 start_codon:yes stop_codon:yes gene_type:complete